MIKTRNALARALNTACLEYAQTTCNSIEQARFDRYTHKISQLLDRCNQILEMKLLFVVPIDSPLPIETKYYEDEFMDIVQRINTLSQFDLHSYIRS